MLTLNDGRNELYQWDTGRVATVSVDCDAVHFSNLKYGNSLSVAVINGTVAIPNQLLLNNAPLYCWAFVTDDDGAYTKKEQTIEVIKRAKPANYVYTETEMLTIQTAVEDALKKAKESGEFDGEKGEKGDSYIITEADKTEIISEVSAEIDAKLKTLDDIKESISPLTEAQTIVSVNLYDPSLQTPETISPHYWVGGKPYKTTQFDNTYNCTAPIAIEPNTTYTIGLVPFVGNNCVRPWNTASEGIHVFDADGNFLKGFESNTFTTPINATYIRFNYFKSGQMVSLDVLNARCMLVKGDTLPTVYSPYGSYTTTSLLERLSNYSPPVQYNISNNVLRVASHYTTDKDLLVTMNLGRGNGLFDFASFKLMPYGMDIESGEALAEILMANSTDWHAPFIVRATENADGDDVGNSYFTGGNHQYNNRGSGSTATARSLSLRFFADGREVISEKGYANNIEIRWVNNAQGYNTRKADGSGREILQERHRLVFDGCEWSETIELESLEQIYMERWYGLQFVRTPIYPNYHYIGAEDRKLHQNDSSDCGGKNADGIVAYGTEHKIEMTIDTGVDLGKRVLSGGTGALCSSDKAYMFIIDSKQMEIGEVYRLCGGYKFMPA